MLCHARFSCNQKAPSATFRFLLARANVPLSTNRYHQPSWRLVGETFQWNISCVRKHACSGAFDMIIRSACALLLWCLFSRIMSLRVFSETSLGKRVNLVLSDFNHLLDWEAEVLRFFFEVSCWCWGGRLEDAREGGSANGVKCDNHWNLFPRFPEFCSHSLRRTSESDFISL